MQNPLLDKEFLKQLDLEEQKTKYVKIIALDINENPIEEITGVATQGSINIDGNSAVRRTCSLTLVANEVNYNDYLWGLNTKIELQIGIENSINTSYPEIIWFKQGVYLLTSFSMAQSDSSYTISLQGKDKMCLLNGDVAGILPMSVDFGNVTIEDENGIATTQKLKIIDIITSLVHTYGKEELNNIYINDVPEQGLELLCYKGSTPMYYILDSVTLELKDIITDGDKVLNFAIVDDVDEKLYATLNIISIANDKMEEAGKDYCLFYEKIYNEVWGGKKFKITDTTPKEFKEKLDNDFYIVKIEAGQSSAYKDCDLVYNGDLIANAGDSITSVLDKIVKQLGNYEYFYNLDGQFIFRQKKTYINTSWNNLVSTLDEETYAEDIINLDSTEYSFDNQKIIHSFNLNPNFENVKNDYSIWGTRKNVYGNYDIPVHLRYAINKKPIYYKDYRGENMYISLDCEKCPKEVTHYTYISYLGERPEYLKNTIIGVSYKRINLEESEVTEYIRRRVLERQYILDSGVDPNNLKEVKEMWNNADPIEKDFLSIDFALYGKNRTENYEQITYQTGEKRYEKYYIKKLNETIDCNIIFCDWREIIYQMALDYNNHHLKEDFIYKVRGNNFINKYNPVIPADNEDYYLYPYGKTGYEQYYEDMVGFWRELYSPKGGNVFEEINFKDITSDKTVYSTINFTSYGYLEFRRLQKVNWNNVYIVCEDRTPQIENKDKLCYFNVLKLFLKTLRFLGKNWNTDWGSEDTKIPILYLKYKNLVVVEGEAREGEISWDNLPNYPNLDDCLYRQANETIYRPINTYNIQIILYSLLHYLPLLGSGFSNFIPNMYNTGNIAIIEKKKEPFLVKTATSGSYNIGTIGLHDTEVTKTVNEIPYYIKRGTYDTEDGWNQLIYKTPEKLNFWIDFIDAETSEIGKYSANVIGSRPKVVNDSDIKTITYKEIFSVKIVDDPLESEKIKNGYTCYFLGDGFVDDKFQISTLGKSAQDTLNDFLNNYSYCSETINITAAPIYYLEPNQLISIQEEEMGLKKKYEVKSISIPLDYSGTMTISATRIFDTIL